MNHASSECRFSEVKDRIDPGCPDFYEIVLCSGQFLKCEIASDLLVRLLDHAASRQSGLKLKKTATGHSQAMCDRRNRFLQNTSTSMNKLLLITISSLRRNVGGS